MSSGSYSPPIQTPPRPPPYAPMNAMYSGSPGISSLHLVDYLDDSCSIFCIPSTNCLTFVYFASFAHYSSRTSTVFNGLDIPFAKLDFNIYVAAFPMTWRNFLKYDLLLWIVSFRDCNIFHVFLVLVIYTFLIRQKSTLALPFLFLAGPIFFSFASNTGSGLPYLVTGDVGKAVCIPCMSTRYRCIRCSSNFGW